MSYDEYEFNNYDEFIQIFNSKKQEIIDNTERTLLHNLLIKEMKEEELIYLVVIWNEYIKDGVKKYSTITQAVYTLNENSPDEEIYNSNIEKLLKIARGMGLINYSESEKYMKGMFNHIKLAEQQKDYIDHNLLKLKSDLNTATDQVKEIKEIKGKIYGEFVAILGIFTSIVFAVLGGYNEVSTLASSIQGTPIPKLLIFLSLLMLGVNFLVFMSYNAISKLTERPLSSCSCEKENCNCSFRKKHPTVFYSTIFFIYMTLVGFALRLYKKSDFTFSDMYSDPKTDVLPILLMVGPLVITLIYFSINRYLKHKVVKDNEFNKETAN